MTELMNPGSSSVSELIGDPVARVAPDTTMLEVAKTMTQLGVSALGVGDDAELLAVVTEHDVVRAVAADLDLATTRVIESAQTALIWASPDATVAEVANEMMDRWVRHILVGAPHHLVGIVSARDLLGAYAASGDLDFD